MVKAFVVLRDGSPAGDEMVKALQDFAKSRIAPYKYPRRVEFVDGSPARRRASCSASACVSRRRGHEPTNARSAAPLALSCIRALRFGAAVASERFRSMILRPAEFRACCAFVVAPQDTSGVGRETWRAA